MFIMTWSAVAIAFGLLVAWIAHRKGRELVPWWFYGTIAGVIALPHALLLQPRLEERRWSPIRFGLPSGPQACPFCQARIHADAVVCRHCGSALYGALDAAAKATQDQPPPAAPPTARPQTARRAAQQELFAEEAPSDWTAANSRKWDDEAAGDVEPTLRMNLPPPRQQSPIFGQFAIVMVLCAATALGTVWLTGPPLQDLDLLPADNADLSAAQGRVTFPPRAFPPPLRGGTMADRPQATGKPLALEPPSRPKAVPPPDTPEDRYIPPRAAVLDSGGASDPAPPSSPTPPVDLVRDVKSVLGKLKRKPKAEDGGDGKADEKNEGGDRIVASGDLVKDLQRRLKAKGFNPGTIDGKAGHQTVTAMRAFQRKSGLPETENISRAVLIRLGIMQPGTPKMVLQVERPMPADARNAEAAAHDRINIE